MYKHPSMLARADVDLDTQVKYETFQAIQGKFKGNISETKDKIFCSSQE